MERHHGDYPLGSDGTMTERWEQERPAPRSGALTAVQQILPVLGRFFLALIFIIAGLNKIGGWEGTASHMVAQGLPLVTFLLVLTVAIEVLGGLSVLLGFQARLGALALLLFLIPTTLIFHNFWVLSGMEQQLQMSMFLKNLSIMGGLLLVMGFGAGPISLDHRKRRTGAERAGLDESHGAS